MKKVEKEKFIKMRRYEENEEKKLYKVKHQAGMILVL